MNNKKSPQFASTMKAHNNKQLSYYNEKRYRRTLDKSLLPTPAAYYKDQFPKMKIKSEWVTVQCCFHDDGTPSLGLNMENGHFRCHSCGAKGGDIIAFHMRLNNLGFCKAVSVLGGWRDEL